MSRFAAFAAFLSAAACSTEGPTVPDPPPSSPSPTRVVMNPIPNPVMVGDSFALTAQVLNDADLPIHGAKVTWSSANPSIAAINQFGRVHVHETGKTTITATHEGLNTGRELVTWGEVAGIITVDGDPESGLSVRLGDPYDLGAPETVTDSLGRYQFLHLEPDEYGVIILGSYIGFDHSEYGFQVTEQRVSVDLGNVAPVDFQGFSIPQCETPPLIKLEFVNNDPVFDDYWRSAVCRWTNIVSDIAFTECILRSFDGVVVVVEYVDTFEAREGRVRFCNESPWYSDFKVPRSSLYDPEHWLVPGQVYKHVSRSIASALGIISTNIPAWNDKISAGDPMLFMGAEAARELHTLSGSGHLEVRLFENWAYWADAVFCNEILGLGGASSARSSAPISAVTVAAIEDVGIYEVNRDAAEPFLPYDCPATSAEANGPIHALPVTIVHR